MHSYKAFPIIKSLCFLGLLSFINACALIPEKPSLSAIPQTDQQRLQAFKNHKLQLNDLTNWQLEGRIGIKSPEGVFTGQLNWEQQEDVYSITISGPLGQGATSIKGNDQEIILSDGKTGEISRGDPITLMNQSLGWSLPMAQIKLWIKGHPGHEELVIRLNENDKTINFNNTPVTDITLNKANTLARLKHGIWQVEIPKYRFFKFKNQELSLPQKIVASNDRLKLTFFIKDWSTINP